MGKRRTEPLLSNDALAIAIGNAKAQGCSLKVYVERLVRADDCWQRAKAELASSPSEFYISPDVSDVYVAWLERREAAQIDDLSDAN